MNKPVLNVITRCTRPDNLPLLWDSMGVSGDHGVLVKWFVLFDTSMIVTIGADILTGLYREGVDIRFTEGTKGDYGHILLNDVLDDIEDGWVYVLDDDNTIDSNLLMEFAVLIKTHPDKRVLLFSQDVGGRDFTKLKTRVACPDNIRVGGVDMAQFIVRRDLIGNRRFPNNTYVADGVFISELYRDHPQDFLFCDKILTLYNSIDKTIDMGPRVSTMGVSVHGNGILNVSEVEVGGSFKDEIIHKDPQVIMTTGDWRLHTDLASAPYYIRKRWLNLDKNEISTDVAYGSVMNSILNKGELKRSISYFTPMYNTGERLVKTYQTLVSQTIPDWEWVLVDDSDDGGHTLRVAKDIADMDYRVKVFSIRPHSGGCVGEAKHRAVSMCRFSILAELDHDDLLLPHCTETLIKAVSNNPDVGFFYSDYALVGDDMRPKDYGPTFTFGYGSYYETDVYGVRMKVVKSNNINPKTIRHIVGVPNHIRVWTREGYEKSGGYNRMMQVADDYDLLVRTFLKCEIVRIESCLYVQVLRADGGNTHVKTRDDIQRRVSVISSYYEQDIRNRFTELDVEDWASGDNKYKPLRSVSRFGDEESYTNRVWRPISGI